MSTGFLPRFAVEIAFLALLALAVGLAELETPWIVLVMATGWVLVVLVEWLAWRAEQEDEPAVLDEGRTGADGEPDDAWDMADILAPLPEEEPGDAEPGDPARRAGEEA